MDMMQLLAILITISGLFLWNRAEGRSDIRHMDTKLDAIRELVRAIQDEMKDFHKRLCDIEERNKERK